MIRIGICGWRYEPWRGVWYPEGLPQRRELEFCGWHFPTVEINGSFYSLQRPQYCEEWHRDTPPGFLFAVKGSRYLTHLRCASPEKETAACSDARGSRSTPTGRCGTRSRSGTRAS